MTHRQLLEAALTAPLVILVTPVRGSSGVGELPWNPSVEVAWEARPSALPFAPSIPAGPRQRAVLPPRLVQWLSLRGSLAALSPPPPAKSPNSAPAPASLPAGPAAWGEASATAQALERGSRSLLPPDFELHGFLKASASQVHQARYPLSDDLSRDMTLDGARLSFATGTDFLSLYLSVEGSSDHGTEYLTRSGELGDVEFLDAYAGVRLADGLELRAGNFKAPILFSSMLDENELLFVDHTGISRTFQERSLGVALHGERGRMQGWLALQDGMDPTREDWAWTVRGTLQLFGEGIAPRREGAYDADLGETLHMGASWHQDNSVADYRSFALEAYYSLETFALAGELIVPGDGTLGGSNFWNATASAMLVPERWEVALRVENFRTRADAMVWRLGLNHYLSGPTSKVQLAVSRLEHENSHLDLTALDLTLLVSF